ncbi:hypothetical protein DFQ26_007999 [Actinomortierella ambigua]|nr:hypothetical protein DFQ26_007999 [Actinomortierella ambigua]
MSSTPKPAKQPKQSKESTEPGTPHETDASPANASSVLTLRTTMALVLVLCLAIQQLAPSAFLAALFGTGNTDTASPTWTNTAKDATRGGGGGGDSRGGGGEGSSSTWAARPSVKPIMFGTPDPQAFSAPPRFTSGSSSKGQGEERRRRSDSPFRDFFNQSEDDQPTPGITVAKLARVLNDRSTALANMSRIPNVNAGTGTLAIGALMTVVHPAE